MNRKRNGQEAFLSVFMPGYLIPLQVYRNKTGPLLQVGIRAVEGQIHPSVERAEQHAMAAILQKERIALDKVSVDIPVIRYSQSLGISFFRKA